MEQKKIGSKSSVISCALKGCNLCPDKNCNGINRKCDLWLNHSSK